MANILSRKGQHDQGERRIAILAALNSGAKTHREIADLSGFHREGLRAHLAKLMDDGFIVRTDETLNRTVYRLAKPGETSTIADRNRLGHGERQRQILELVEAQGITASSEIAEVIPVGRSPRKRALKALRDAGKLEFVKLWTGDGLYRSGVAR